MKDFLLLAIVLLLCLGVAWDAAWEARPAGTEPASDLDLFITETKDEVADRVSVESNFGTLTSDDNGLMRLGSARCFLQAAAPTDILGPGQYNSSAGIVSGTALATEEVGASTIDLGTARCWIDTDGLDGVAANSDDNQLNVYIDNVGWTAVRANPMPITVTPAMVVTTDVDTTAVALPSTAAGTGNPFLTATATGVASAMHEVVGTVSVQITDTANEPIGFLRLTETCGAGSETTVFQAICGDTHTNASPSTSVCTVPMYYINTAPVAAELCTYRVRAWYDPSNATSGTYSPLISGEQMTSRLYVKQILRQ